MSLIACERRRLGNAGVTVGNGMSGGGCIYSASNGLPLNPFFLVKRTKKTSHQFFAYTLASFLCFFCAFGHLYIYSINCLTDV
jgi:hypothetical protein